MLVACSSYVACSTYGEEQRGEAIEPTGGTDAGSHATDDATRTTIVTEDSGGLPNESSVPPSAAVLIADWPFTEGSGTVVADVSGRQHHGSAKASSWTSDRASVAGSALLLDGTTSLVVVPGHSDFDRPAGARFTMMAWARADATPDHAYLLDVGFGSEGYGIELRSATSLCYWDGNAHTAVGMVSNVVGAWHHYAIAVDGAIARTYFDGVRIAEAAADTTPRTATTVEMGHDVVEPAFFKGALDKVRFYRGALSDAEIAAEMSR